MTPNTLSRINGLAWAADNGRFARPELYADDKYLRWLDRFDSKARSNCLFATAPDVLCDARATTDMSAKVLPKIRDAGYPAAYVGQDGLTFDMVDWTTFDAFFIGGSTEWKLGPDAASLAQSARLLGKWVHMGRVNSLKRMMYAKSIGCDSVDGNVLKYDPQRPVKKWIEMVNT